MAAPGGEAFSFDFRAAQDVIDDMSTVQGQLNMAVNNLDTYSDSQLVYWAGEARRTYRVVKKKWDDGARAMNGLLGTTGHTLETIKNNFQTSDNVVRITWEGGY